MIKILLPIAAMIVFAVTDALTTLHGINTNAGEEMNFVANFFMQHFGIINGMIIREMVVTVPFMLISFFILKWMTVEHPKHIQSTIQILPVYIVATIHLAATINNLMIIGNVMIEGRPFPKPIYC